MGEIIKAEGKLPGTVLDRIVASLDAGGLVCLATDTVYGLSCVAEDERAVRAIAKLKGSRREVFLVLIGGIPWLGRLAAEVPECALKLMEHYWPGPLTLIFRALDGVPEWLRGPRGTIAVRLPGSPLCGQLVNAVGRPLVSTSANARGGKPCLTGKEAADSFLHAVDFVIDSGGAVGKLPSTIVDVTVKPHAIVREGGLKIDKSLL